MAAMVKSVEFIEVTQSGTEILSSVDLTQGQDYANCVPFMTLHGLVDYMDNHFMDVYFSGTGEAGIINFQRDEHRSSAMYIKCYVVEFDSSEIKVQQGSFTELPAAVTTAYDTPSSFTQTKTAMVHYWSSTSATRAWDIHLVMGRVLSNGTQVDMYRNQAGGTVSGHYFLFEDISTGNDHLIVDHQSLSFTSTGLNALIPPAQQDTTRTFIIASHACSDGGITHNGRQTVRIYTHLTAAGRCDKSDGLGTIWYQIQFVTFQDQTKVYVPYQSYTGFNTVETTITRSWDRSCNTNLSAVIPTIPMGMSRGDINTAPTQINSLWASMTLTSGTGVQFQRASTGSARASYFGYSIVDWGGIVVDTGSNPDPLDPDISFVKSVENFRMDVDDYQVDRDLSKGQDFSNCAVFASQRNSAGNADIRESLHNVWLREPGVVVAHRSDAGGAGVVDVSVVEFYPDQVKVQTGRWVHWSTDTEVATISGVSDTENAFVLAKWETDAGDWWSRVSIRVRFTANDTLEFYRHDASEVICGTFFVIEDLQNNFRVGHHIDSGTTYTNFFDDNYYPYDGCLPIASCANDNDNLYVDRGCSNTYQTGVGGRMIIRKNTGTGTVYSSFMWVRFLDERIHTQPFFTTMDSSTTSNTQAVADHFAGHEDALTVYNPMQLCTGRGASTGGDDMQGIFHTYRFINGYDDVENSREATVGVVLNPSQGGLIDWIGYTHADANEKHQITYAYPTKSIVRSIEKFTYNGTERLIFHYLSKGQRPGNCVPFSSKRIGVNANEINRLLRFQHIDSNSRLGSIGELGPNGGNLDEIIYVVEFDSAQVRVQQLWKTMNGTSVNVTIPQEVDLTKTFMIFNYTADNYANRWDYNALTGSFLSSTELNFSRYTGGALGMYIAIYLVECLQDQWYVVHHDGESHASTSADDYITSNTMGCRMVQGSYSISNIDMYTNRNCFRLYPLPSSGFQWNRNNATGSQTDRHTEVVDFNTNLGVRVGGSFIDIPAETTETKDTYILGGLDLDRSITFSTIVNDINRVDGTGTDDITAVCVKCDLTDPDTLTFSKYNAGPTTYGYGQFVEWPAYKTHYFEGTVTEKNLPVVRQVACFRADTNELMDSTTSSGTGFYYLETTYSGAHYIVCQDDEQSPDYNHLILGKMEPYPLPTYSGGEIIYG